MRLLKHGIGGTVATFATFVSRAADADHEGLPTYAAKVFKLGPLAITNSMVITIAVTVLLVIFAQLVSRDVKTVPSGLQNFGEWAVESLYNFLGDILGAHLVKKTFWFFGSIFFFILATNWISLVPGVGTLGWEYVDQAGHRVGAIEPWLRGGNADLNMTSAMSLLFFALWIIWAFQENGLVGFLKHIFGAKGDTTGLLKILMVFIFLFVGVLECVSIAFRPVSLSFRLYGNIFAGENILEAMMKVVPALSWLVPLPFYFLELLVGFVQAVVFTLLTSIFTLLICQHDEEHEGAHEKHAH